MAVAAIGQNDWPEDWPELLPFLLKLIGDQSNGNGGTRVFCFLPVVLNQDSGYTVLFGSLELELGDISF